MIFWRNALCAWVSAIYFVSFVSIAVAGDLDGDYEAHGKDPAGKAYSGDVLMKSFGPTEAIVWRLQGNSGYKGLGLVSGDVLGAAYAPDTGYFGVVIYQVRGGILEGIWTAVSHPKATGREVLEGPAGLSGTYKITTGEQLDGLTNYTGQVIIKPNGKTYLVAWLTPKPSAVGIGVLVDDKLVVAFGNQRIPGVVGYRIGDRALEGIWSSGSSTEIGTETLTRKP